MRSYHSAICRQHLNIFYCAPKKFNVDGILLGDKNATSLAFNIISTLMVLNFARFRSQSLGLTAVAIITGSVRYDALESIELTSLMF